MALTARLVPTDDRIPDLLDPESDRVLVIRSAAGDRSAFATIVRRHSPLMRSVAQQLLRNRADADDVVQETFLAAWLHVDDVIDGATIVGWLVTTAKRKSYDRLRSASTRRTDALDLDLPAPHHHGPEAAGRLASMTTDIGRALAGMPDAQRRCWQLREMEGLTYDEIARELGVRSSTVRGMLARARSTMARDLAHWR